MSFSEAIESRPSALEGAIYSWTEFANQLKTNLN